MKQSLGAKTLIYPTPVWCVGSYDAERRPNVMTIAWGGICCSKPPCVTISLQKARYTYSNIMQHRAYTISVPSKNHVREADYFGMVSGKTVDKFAVTGLTAVAGQFVDAPYVQEFPMVLECKVTAVYELGVHTQFIGEIMDVKVDRDLLDAGGIPDLNLICPILFAPEARFYYGAGEPLGQAFSMGKEFNA